MKEEIELLTVNEMAQILKVPPSWIYARTRLKGPDTIPRINCGKYIRFYPSEVMKWLKEKQSKDEVG